MYDIIIYPYPQAPFEKNWFLGTWNTFWVRLGGENTGNARTLFVMSQRRIVNWFSWAIFMHLKSRNDFQQTILVCCFEPWRIAVTQFLEKWFNSSGLPKQCCAYISCIYSMDLFFCHHALQCVSVLLPTVSSLRPTWLKALIHYAAM